MSSYYRAIRLWFRAERVAMAVLLALGASARGQQAPPPEQGRPMPSGLQILSVSAWTGEYALGSRGAGGDGSSLWLLRSGLAADIGWHVLRRRTDFRVRYDAGYSYTSRFSTLNGFDHALSLDLRREVGLSTFTLVVNAASRLLSDALFEPGTGFAAAQQVSSPGELAGAIGGNAQQEALNSPFNLSLSGVRRRSGNVEAGFSRSLSPRLTSRVNVGVARELRTGPGDAALRFPSTTVGTADVGLTYSLTRRTTLSGTCTYARGYSSLSRSDWSSAALSVQHAVGRR